jgi:hypothetical protein
VETVGRETLTFEARGVEAVHFRLLTDGTATVRDVWTDAGGRVVKVTIPAERMVAIRDF